MNPTKHRPTIVCGGIVLAVQLLIPGISWAQSKIYTPPKVYTPPPKVNAPAKNTTAPAKSSPPAKQPAKQQGRQPGAQQPTARQQNQQPRVQQQSSSRPYQKGSGKTTQAPTRKGEQRHEEASKKQQTEQRRAHKKELKQQRNLQKQQRKEQKQLRKEQSRGQKAQQNRQKESPKREKQQARTGRTTPTAQRWKMPRGRVSRLPGGGRAVVTATGTRYEFSKEGTLNKFSRGGMEASFRPDGKFSSVKANGMSINYGGHGERTIVTERPDHSLLVSTGPHSGYLERAFTVNNRPYLERMYVVNHTVYTSVYRRYDYGGVVFDVYVPTRYFHPSFYVWALRPWPMPAYYGWGWSGQPWYGYYGYYFGPSSMYPNSSLWLTDNLLSQDLQLAYQLAQQFNTDSSTAGSSDGADEAPDPTPAEPLTPQGNQFATTLTPEAKQAIAGEVERQVVAEQRQATANPQRPLTDGAAPPALTPTQRVFVVSSNLQEQTPEGSACVLTPGDVIARLGDTPDSDHNVAVVVLSSKYRDCAGGSQIAVAVQDLQDMHNRFAEQIDSGLKTLAEARGKGGLPLAPNTTTSYGEIRPPMPDADVEGLLHAQLEEADRTETQLHEQAFDQLRPQVH